VIGSGGREDFGSVQDKHMLFRGTDRHGIDVENDERSVKETN